MSVGDLRKCSGYYFIINGRIAAIKEENEREKEKRKKEKRKKKEREREKERKRERKRKKEVCFSHYSLES